MRTREEYLANKRKLKEEEFIPREYCSECGFSKRTCYCQQVKPFDSKITFAILIHKLEIERKIATGTMSHLVLKNSHLIKGYDYTDDELVNNLINDPNNFPVVMYPGEGATNISKLSYAEKKMFVPKGKKLVIFVIDGTWRTARQTMRLSQNLNQLPRISFDIDGPSKWRVRKQPKPEYCSTVEAIHKTIDLFEDTFGYDYNSRAHDNLMDVFEFMVNNQIQLREQRLKSK